MNNQSILISVVCGLVAAMLFLSPIQFASFGFILSSFTAFPLFVSVLGFGTVAGIVSAAICAIIVAIFFGLVAAFSVLTATLVPVLWIGHSAGLSREDNGIVEWFPVPEILTRLAIVSAAIILLMGVVSGYSHEWAVAQSTQIIEQVSEMQSQASADFVVPSEEHIRAQAEWFAGVIPFFMPFTMLLFMVMNLRLAERFTRSRGWMLRPRDDLPTTTAMPLYACGVFAAAIILSYFGGSLGLVAKTVAGAFGCAFVLVGLATIHTLTRKMPLRGLALGALYALLFMVIIILPFVAMLGVAETLFQLRARAAVVPPSNFN